MHILIVGNYTCANRGDCAILRGLVTCISRSRPDIRLTIFSDHPVASSQLSGLAIRHDPFHLHQALRGRSLNRKMARFLERKIYPLIMWLKLLRRGRTIFNILPLPAHYRAAIRDLQDADGILCVGGSNLVDLYGYRKFVILLAALLAERPVALAGHSVGPFDKPMFRRIARTLFSGFAYVGLREPVSRSVMDRAGISAPVMHEMSDTAWLVDPADAKGTGLNLPRSDRPRIAVTMRILHPFDERLNCTQEQYERAFADLADDLIGLGYSVLAVPTCTPIGGYHRDDRAVASRVSSHVSDKEHFAVLSGEPNDLELGAVFRTCELTVGTRLHSAIISMNFGTPAVALNYEHKSEGVFRQLGLTECQRSIQDLISGRLRRDMPSLLARLPELRAALPERVAQARALARDGVERAVHTLERANPGRSRAQCMDLQ